MARTDLLQLRRDTQAAFDALTGDQRLMLGEPFVTTDTGRMYCGTSNPAAPVLLAGGAGENIVMSGSGQGIFFPGDGSSPVSISSGTSPGFQVSGGMNWGGSTDTGNGTWIGNTGDFGIAFMWRNDGDGGGVNYLGSTGVSLSSGGAYARLSTGGLSQSDGTSASTDLTSLQLSQSWGGRNGSLFLVDGAGGGGQPGLYFDSEGDVNLENPNGLSFNFNMQGGSRIALGPAGLYMYNSSSDTEALIDGSGNAVFRTVTAQGLSFNNGGTEVTIATDGGVIAFPNIRAFGASFVAHGVTDISGNPVCSFYGGDGPGDPATMGLFGVTPVGQQPTPTDTASIITLLQAYGLCP